jgi:hypothetical protein
MIIKFSFSINLGVYSGICPTVQTLPVESGLALGSCAWEKLSNNRKSNVNMIIVFFIVLIF